MALVCQSLSACISSNSMPSSPFQSPKTSTLIASTKFTFRKLSTEGLRNRGDAVAVTCSSLSQIPFLPMQFGVMKKYPTLDEIWYKFGNCRLAAELLVDRSVRARPSILWLDQVPYCELLPHEASVHHACCHCHD